MNIRRQWLVLVGASFATAALWAAEPAAPPTQQPTVKPAPAQAGKPAEATTAAAKPADAAPDTAAKPDAAKPDAAKPDPAKPGAAQAAAKPGEKTATATEDKSSPQRFIPTEQVRADFDVSFPIDI